MEFSAPTRSQNASYARPADLWVQASLEQRQRFRPLFFPEGISFDGNSFVRTGVTAPVFSYFQPIRDENERMVDQTGASWNRVGAWLRRIKANCKAA